MAANLSNAREAMPTLPAIVRKNKSAPLAARLSALGLLGHVLLLFVAIGLVGTIYAAFRFRPSWFIWMAGNMLLFVST